MTTWVIDSYQRGVESVWNGFTVAIRVPLRPRVTKNWLWLEYIVNYVAHDEDLLEQLMNAYVDIAEHCKKMTGYHLNLKGFDKNFGRRTRFKKDLLVPET